MENIIEIQHLKKDFGENHVLKDINLTVKKEKLLPSSALQVLVSPLCFVVSMY